jgi:plasmid stabilization system protein ParE
VNTVVESLVAYPERFPVVYRQTRRVNLPRFTYSLFYRIIDDQVIVVACMHGRRHPTVAISQLMANFRVEKDAADRASHP